MKLTVEQELGLGLVGAAAAVGLVFYRDEVVNVVSDIADRGTKLSTSKLDGLVVMPAPDELVAQAEQALGGSLAIGPYSSADVYAVIRMSRSEAGPRDNDLSRQVRMNVALNDAEELGWSLFDLITFSKHADSRGFFGRQEDGRRYASTNDPYGKDWQLFADVVNQRAQGIDLAQGGVKFVDTKSMGVQPGTGKWEDLVARWAKEGLHPYQLALEGLPSDLYIFKRG